jgi:hypothetical protein
MGVLSCGRSGTDDNEVRGQCPPMIMGAWHVYGIGMAQKSHENRTATSASGRYCVMHLIQFFYVAAHP